MRAQLTEFISTLGEPASITLSNQLAAVFAKLGVASRFELVALATQHVAP